MSTTIDRKAAMLDGKLAALLQKRAALDTERDIVSEKLSRIQHRFVAGKMLSAMADAFRHRLNRLPVIMAHVDEEIRQAEADIDNHRHWHPTV